MYYVIFLFMFEMGELRTVIAAVSAFVGLLVLLLVTDVPREEQRSLWRIVAEELPKTLK